MLLYYLLDLDNCCGTKKIILLPAVAFHGIIVVSLTFTFIAIGNNRTVNGEWSMVKSREFFYYWLGQILWN